MIKLKNVYNVKIKDLENKIPNYSVYITSSDCNKFTIDKVNVKF